jgi:hypothetical protein
MAPASAIATPHTSSYEDGQRRRRSARQHATERQ